MRNIAISTIALAVSCSAFILGACDTDDDQSAALAAEVDRLQAENDALRSAARLTVAAPVDLMPAPSVEFREQGKPWQKVIPVPQPQSVMFDIMTACKVKQKVTISDSGYLPDVTKADQRVLSLAYSFMGSKADEACLNAEMVKRGAVDL